jgi:hypothetical protein
LPVSIERTLAKTLQELSNDSALLTVLRTKESALKRLEELSNKHDAQSGPVHVGAFSETELEQLVKNAAGIYLSAFEENKKCFPFMRGADES